MNSKASMNSGFALFCTVIISYHSTRSLTSPKLLYPAPPPRLANIPFPSELNPSLPFWHSEKKIMHGRKSHAPSILSRPPTNPLCFIPNS
ncbi:hypothetical protein M433DRAFT_420540 [Acidomyces richmondensis BFW]|nr:MAG: hypothetical protein FE78DRAFT_202119 [Acidomyces sp. 'richmondensis']KYG42281.1 hypothetical protein M433DRAFT_420540 [Acidomyces richmondensis BFW]